MTALNRQEEMEFQLLATVNICIIIMTMVSIMGIIMLIIDFTMARLRPMARCQHIMEQQRHLNGRIETLHTSILQAITTLCSLQITNGIQTRSMEDNLSPPTQLPPIIYLTMKNQFVMTSQRFGQILKDKPTVAKPIKNTVSMRSCSSQY